MQPTTRPFETLTYRGQVMRMRALARRVLPRFRLRRDAPLKLCGHGENTVFRTWDGSGRSFALRIHRLDYQSPATIRSEMQWLAALAQDTELTVPVPRRGRDGEHVQRVDDAGVPGTRSCVLLEWMDGAIVGRRRAPGYWKRLGELTASLHAHGRSWRRPAGFTRRRWDETELLSAPAFGDPFETPGLRRPDRELLTSARDRALEQLAEFGKGRRRWGLVHADLHAGNVVRQGDALGTIDFDDCGFGWYLYDIVVAAVMPVWRTPAYEKVMGAFLEGYRRVLPFDDGDLDCAEAFVVARNFSMVGWLASRRDNPGLAKQIPWMIRRARTTLRPYLGR